MGWSLSQKWWLIASQPPPPHQSKSIQQISSRLSRTRSQPKENHHQPFHSHSHSLPTLFARWWFQPLWKIWVKIGSSSPSFGMNIKKNIWVATIQLHIHISNSFFLSKKNLTSSSDSPPSFSSDSPSSFSSSLSLSLLLSFVLFVLCSPSWSSMMCRWPNSKPPSAPGQKNLTLGDPSPTHGNQGNPNPTSPRNKALIKALFRRNLVLHNPLFLELQTSSSFVDGCF